MRSYNLCNDDIIPFPQFAGAAAATLPRTLDTGHGPFAFIRTLSLEPGAECVCD